MGPLTKTVSCKNATFRWSLVSPDAPKAESQSFLESLRFWSPKPTPVILETPAEEEAFELRDVTLSCEPGLTLIFGPTGSGKSSLLNALLGEMDLLQGEHNLPKLPGHYDPLTGLHGGISYCARQSWLQQRSIRDNILFGSPFEQERYEQVLEACALNPDLAIFEDGDMQEIVEGGISLSGGQKARCALARAVYSRARTVLLDDVLSAVDSHTAEHIVRNCLQGPLMKNRCIVLVTHHVELVTPIAFHAIKIEEGRIVASGSPQELRTAGLLQDLAELEQSNEGEQEAEKTPTAKPKLGAQDGKRRGNSSKKRRDRRAASSGAFTSYTSAPAAFSSSPPSSFTSPSAKQSTRLPNSGSPTGRSRTMRRSPRPHLHSCKESPSPDSSHPHLDRPGRISSYMDSSNSPKRGCFSPWSCLPTSAPFAPPASSSAACSILSAEPLLAGSTRHPLVAS